MKDMALDDLSDAFVESLGLNLKKLVMRMLNLE